MPNPLAWYNPMHTVDATGLGAKLQGNNSLALMEKSTLETMGSFMLFMRDLCLWFLFIISEIPGTHKGTPPWQLSRRTLKKTKLENEPSGDKNRHSSVLQLRSLMQFPDVSLGLVSLNHINTKQKLAGDHVKLPGPRCVFTRPWCRQGTRRMQWPTWESAGLLYLSCA